MLITKQMTLKEVEKLIADGKAWYTGAYRDGNLIDDMMLEYGDGFMACYETPINTNQSIYDVRIATEISDFDAIWDEWYTRIGA